MSKIRIRFNESYFEFDDEELRPEIYYDLTDGDLIHLFNKRRTVIKNLESNVSLYNKKTEEQDKLMFEEIINIYINNLDQLEKEIKEVSKNKNIILEWFHLTEAQNSSEVPVIENQRIHVCNDCGKIFDTDIIYDFEHRDEEDIINAVCPVCKEKDVIRERNIYLYRADLMKEKIEIISDINEKVELYDNVLHELAEVNEFEKYDYESAISETAMVHQNKARCFITLNKREEAFEEINIAIQGWKAAMEKKIYFGQNVLAMAYFIREVCCLNLNRQVDSVLQDGEEVMLCLREFLEFNLAMAKERNEYKYLDNVLEEYQAVSMMNYANMKYAMVVLEKPKGEIKTLVDSALIFLNKCDKLSEKEKKDYYMELNSN